MKRKFKDSFITPSDKVLHMGMPKTIKTTRVQLQAPDFLAGIRAAFVADVHLRANATDAWLSDLTGLISQLNADLLLFGGDYAEELEQEKRWFSALGKLPRARLGAYAVPGNNDTECFEHISEMQALAAENGVQLLVNQCINIPLNGKTLAIAGIDELRHGNPKPEGLFGDCDESSYKLLLSHYPLWFDDLEPNLQLSGHTHGGQFNFFGITPYSICFEKKLVSVIKGIATRKDSKMLVSQGLGYSRLPLRFGASAEVHLVEFTKD